MSKKIALILHNNFEEGEAVVTIDILRRAGLDVKTFSVENNLEVKGSHKIIIKAEHLLSELKVEDFDGLVLPGGPGCDNLLNRLDLHEIIQLFNNEKKMIAAICGAPQVLGAAKILDKVKIVKHPTVNQFIDQNMVQKENTFIDKNILTGVSIGTTIPFALNIVEYLLGKEQAKKTEKNLVIF